MIDNSDLFERHELKRLSKPHIEDVAGREIFEGDKYVKIGGVPYSWETLEEISEYWEEE